MPNRILKESICTSEEIDKLSLFHEVFFYRLIVNCDDYGRMDARPRVIASRLFPLKDVPPEDVVTALLALRDDGLIILYEHENKPYLQVKTWQHHQNVRNQKSKYPSPDDDDCRQLQTIDINCNQMKSIDSKCPRNPIQSNPYPNPNPNPNLYPNPNPNPSCPGADAPERAAEKSFEEFWELYPRKEAKKNALSAWKKIHINQELMEKIMSGLRKQIRSEQWTRDGGRFIPLPASWLNGRRWEDEVRTSAQPARQERTNSADNFEQRDWSNVNQELMDDLAKRMAAFEAGKEIEI